MDPGYAITPLVAWLASGSVKFTVNSLRAGRLAPEGSGYGGFPSSHTAIVTSAAAAVGFREDLASPAFCVALALCMIVIMDALSLRRRIGEQAAAINRLQGPDLPPLRERIGHHWYEMMGGAAVGIGCAWLVLHALRWAA